MQNRLSPILLILAVLIFGVFSASAGSPVPKSYPLDTCVVSGEKLGEHGRPIKVSSNGTDIYLCCKSCVKDFNKNPAKYVKMVKYAAGGK